MTRTGWTKCCVKCVSQPVGRRSASRAVSGCTGRHAVFAADGSKQRAPSTADYPRPARHSNRCGHDNEGKHREYRNGRLPARNRQTGSCWAVDDSWAAGRRDHDTMDQGGLRSCKVGPRRSTGEQRKWTKSGKLASWQAGRLAGW